MAWLIWCPPEAITLKYNTHSWAISPKWRDCAFVASCETHISEPRSLWGPRAGRIPDFILSLLIKLQICQQPCWIHNGFLLLNADVHTSLPFGDFFLRSLEMRSKSAESVFFFNACNIYQTILTSSLSTASDHSHHAATLKICLAGCYIINWPTFNSSACLNCKTPHWNVESVTYLCVSYWETKWGEVTFSEQ